MNQSPTHVNPSVVSIQDVQQVSTLLVGETTFGAGTVLDQFDLADGSALLLATEEWLTPAGRAIWHHRISPDVTVAPPQGTLPLQPTAQLTVQQLNSSGDAQLLRALSLLTGAVGQ